MPSIINATTTTGVAVTGDTSGALALQTNNGTTAVTIDTSQNVGIGTTTPSQRLTVRTSGTSTSAGGNIAARIESNGSGYASTLQFSDNIANSAYISMIGSATAFGQAGTERMRIDSSGNVGIGNTNPSSFFSEARNLVVGSGSGGQGITIFAGTASQSRLMFADGTSGADAYTGFVQYDHSSNALAFGTNGGNERGRFDSSGNFLFNSGYGSVATAYGCRAWVSFNGTGTPAIRGSGNVSSITDDGTGRFRVNFTNAMPDANYSAVATARASGTVTGFTSLHDNSGAYSTTQVAVTFYSASDGYIDPPIFNVAVFR